MKNAIKFILQKVLGYQGYLSLFAKYKIRTLKRDRKEKDFFAFMAQVDKPGAIMDVGANIGIMTYHLAKQFPDRKIIAIEPMPDNFSILSAIIKRYAISNVELIPSAVGETQTTLDMVLPIKGKVKMQGLAHVVHESIGEWNEGEHLEVNCETLDDIAAGEAVAGIKMDIENFEYFALKGATHILTTHKPVVYLELWENQNRDNCFELLHGCGYQAFVQVNGQLVPFDPVLHKKQNFIFK